MYLWVVLTTFLAMIAAYVLPIRQDTHDLVVVPIAQARLMQMIVKQKAAIQYMVERAWPYYDPNNDGSNAYTRKVNYISGEITSDMISDYLPVGFIDNPDYTTALYCMNEDMTTIKSGSGGCDKVVDETPNRFLLTYGPIPEKWQNISVGEEYEIVNMKPSMDLLDALRSHFSKKEMVGYTSMEDGKVYIVNYEGTKYEVPIAVSQNIGMSHYGLEDCIADYITCLVYMNRR